MVSEPEREEKRKVKKEKRETKHRHGNKSSHYLQIREQEKRNKVKGKDGLRFTLMWKEVFFKCRIS